MLIFLNEFLNQKILRLNYGCPRNPIKEKIKNPNTINLIAFMFSYLLWVKGYDIWLRGDLILYLYYYCENAMKCKVS